MRKDQNMAASVQSSFEGTRGQDAEGGRGGEEECDLKDCNLGLSTMTSGNCR